MTSTELERLNSLSDEVGNFIQYWGFKKIHGKVWTHLYLSTEALDAADLMDRLRISKSLVSITLNDLLKYNVILNQGKGPKDTFVYVCNPEVRSVILDVLKNREAQIIKRIDTEFASFKSQTQSAPNEKINNDRVNSLGQMIGEAQQCLSALTELQSVDFSDLRLS